MWGKRNTNKQTIDMMILSILNNHPDGLTGYAIVKEMAHLFEPFPTPGTGTIYPRLKHLVELKMIQEKGEKSYQITPQGHEHITENVRGIMDESLQFMRVFYRNLISLLPFRMRMDYASGIPWRFNFFGNRDLRETPIFSPEHCGHPPGPISASIEELESSRFHLEQMKKEIQKKHKKELKAFDSQILEITCQIEKQKKHIKKWTKICILDEDEE